jgi:hypothetical protein
MNISNVFYLECLCRFFSNSYIDIEELESKETLSFSMDRVYYIKKVALFVNLQTDLRTVQLVQQLGRK